MACFNDSLSTPEQMIKAGWTCTGEGLVTLITIAKDGAVARIPCVAPLNMIHRFPDYASTVDVRHLDPVVRDITGKFWYDRKQPSQFVKFENDSYHYHVVLEKETVDA